MTTLDQDREVLRRYGIRVPDSQIDQMIKAINSNAAYKEQLEKVRIQVRNPQPQDEFLQELIRSNRDKCTINKPVLKDGTYHIRAINPEEITSVTERAFFNSFNLEKNRPNDLISQKIAPSDQNKDFVSLFALTTTIPIGKEQGEADRNVIIQTVCEEKNACDCGRELPHDDWVSCDNDRNCKGSTWYHYSCVGFTEKDKVEEKPFTCKYCRAAEDASAPIDQPPPSKRRKP